MKKTLAPLTVALALILTACGGQPSAQPAPTETSAAASSSLTASNEPGAPMEYEPGALTGTDFAFAVGMVFGKFSIPGTADKDFLEVMKRYDEDTSNLTFINVAMDNRHGDQEAHAAEVRVYDKAGKEYLFKPAIDFLEAMFEKDQTKMDYDKEYMKFFDRYTDSAKPGEVDEFLMISGDKLPESFERITVNAGGLVGETDAVTLEEGNAQGMPLDF